MSANCHKLQGLATLTSTWIRYNKGFVNGYCFELELVLENINSRLTKKSEFSKKSEFLAQSRSDLPKSAVLTGGMKISALRH
jgi:hypothetical protein